jgi:hypothetical protein
MKIVLTPDWFIGKDILIDVFSFVVLLFFFLLCIKNYKLDKNKKLLYLGVGFAMIGLGELASIFTKLVLYYDTVFTRTIGQLVISSHVVSTVDTFYYIGFFFFRVLALLGLYVIYRLPMKEPQWEEFSLAAFFIIIISILSQDMAYLFRLTAIVILALILKNYYLVYAKNKSKNTLVLLIAFSILMFSNLVYLFAWSDVVYVTANFIELVSYIILLVLVIRILEYGKKKKQNGHHLGYTGDNPAERRKHKTDSPNVQSQPFP